MLLLNNVDGAEEFVEAVDQIKEEEVYDENDGEEVFDVEDGGNRRLRGGACHVWGVYARWCVVVWKMVERFDVRRGFGIRGWAFRVVMSKVRIMSASWLVRKT